MIWKMMEKMMRMMRTSCRESSLSHDRGYQGPAVLPISSLTVLYSTKALLLENYVLDQWPHKMRLPSRNGP